MCSEHARTDRCYELLRACRDVIGIGHEYEASLSLLPGHGPDYHCPYWSLLAATGASGRVYPSLSTAWQLPENAQHCFEGGTDVLLLTIDATRLGKSLKREADSQGELFPHLYGPLSLLAVLAVDFLKKDTDSHPAVHFLYSDWQ